MDTEEHKDRFAKTWATMPGDAFKAALTVFGDAGQALAAVRTLEHDPEVIALRDTYREEARDDVADDAVAAALEAAKSDIASLPLGHPEKTKLIAALLTFGKTTGAGVVVNNNTNVDNRKVMIINDHGDDDAWSAKLQAQQAKLVQDADKPATVN
ncbi:hypothetical protein [Paracoccus phage vB_PmaS-R3]|uniref:Uncharacterized protein n=1 Tax=Paracoccus phage vB_PmaS-R3 TaxID=2494563 RepID=A0A0B5A2J1_9CAUD|nr:terminase small subunit [Paracoccus phage vB_PmaS-R3]AJD83158.1 hypothetical protein [Paracoccus phage vB_PmaS-R3]